jgi:hypothetical protein
MKELREKQGEKRRETIETINKTEVRQEKANKENVQKNLMN